MQSPHVFHPAKSKYLVITVDYLIPFFISLGILVMVYLVLFSKFFTIKDISCTLDFATCSDSSVIAEIDKLKGENIFRLSTEPLTRKLTSGDFTIREVSIIKSLPDKLSVELQSVYPVVALRVEGDSTWVVLDAKFRVIATRDTDPNVPVVIISTPLTVAVGKPLTDEALLSSLKLGLRLSDELIGVKTIALVDDHTIQITLSSGMVAIFSPKIDELKQLRSLQAVLAGGTITEGIRTIDVRFTQPVLR